MEKMTPEEIRTRIDELYPTVKAVVEAVGMTKEDWIKSAIEGPIVREVRCERCELWECEAIVSLKDDYPMFIPVWYSYGCGACSKFIPKEGIEDGI